MPALLAQRATLPKFDTPAHPSKATDLAANAKQNRRHRDNDC
jgi:hypothetical protein